MTDDQKREQKGQVLLDIVETEDHLSALQVKASRLGRSLEHLGKVLQGYPPKALAAPDWDRHAANDTYLSNAHEALSHDVLLELVNEYAATATRLDDLKAQKRALGIVDRPRTT